MTTFVDESAARLRQRRLLQVVCLVAPVLVFVVLAWARRWTFEDGFINFRVVRQIEAGHGPVFNTGQRVEVYTSPLWLLMLLVGDVLLPLKIEWISVVLGIASSTAGLGLAVAGCARIWRHRDPAAFLLPAGALVPVALLPFWVFATSGLEGGLSLLWIGACVYRLMKWAADGGGLGAFGACLLGLGWLIRPEFALLSAAMFAAVLAGRRFGATSAPIWRLLLGFGALPIAYEVFRMGYFVAVIPNTAYAKAAFDSRWHAGFDYLSDFNRTYALWIAIVGIVCGLMLPLVADLRSQLTRLHALVTAAFVIGAVAMATYVVRVGGDYIAARLLLPSLFALCAPVAVVPVRKRFAASVVVAAWALFALGAYRPRVPYETFIGLPERNIVTLDDAIRDGFATPLTALRTPGIYSNLQRIDTTAGPDASDYTVATDAIGLIGYWLGTKVRILDTIGLANVVTARFTLTHRGVPGHEKASPAVWIAAQLTALNTGIDPAWFDIHGLFVPPLIPAPPAGAAFDSEVATVRQALQCGDLKRLRVATSDHLTVAGFFSNLVRSVQYEDLSVPPDPNAAVLEFCGQSPR